MHLSIYKSFIKTLLLGIMALIFVLLIIYFPETAFQASLKGLTTWWEIVLPALLPFFILSELLMGLGVVHFISIMLEPLMRPVFNVPGAGAFVLSMGISSGYPISAKITTKLRQQNMITKTEGERLVCFATTSDPLFMFGAIAVGFFHNPNLGIIIMTAHYVSAIILGICLRNYNKKSEKADKNNSQNYDSLFVKAFKTMHNARIRDNRAIGKLLGDSVMSSLQTIAMIGGFMVFMSVVLSMLNALQITKFLSFFISYLLNFIGLSTSLAPAIITGFFEVTLGCQQASFTDSTSLLEQLLVVSIILAWSGISVHAQIAAILSTSDLRYKPFLYTRIIHSFLAIITTLLLWKPLNTYIQNLNPVFQSLQTNSIFTLKNYVYTFWHYIFILNTSLIFIMLIISIVLYYLKNSFKRLQD